MNQPGLSSNNEHHIFMLRCLDLAQKGVGNVAPNPMVGAVLVYEDNIVAEGFHEFFGGPHAEVNCINALSNKSLLTECTLYVSLEPCSHFGKTPPCANLIVESGIKKVVVCNLDPNPLVAGKGIALLRSNGIEVITGILEEEGHWLNRRFFTYHEKQRPYVILKWAQTANGIVDFDRELDYTKSTPLSITNALSNRINHQWRAEEQAILIGKNTVLADNPSLTTRLVPGKSTVRIVVGNLDYDAKLTIFNAEAKTIVINTIYSKSIGNNHWIIPRNSEITIHSILEILKSELISSVIIEGGPTLHQQFISADLWDETRIFTAKQSIESGIPACLPPFGKQTQTTIDTDILTTIIHV